MKILLLGGTGAMGKSLAHTLVEQAHDVHITSRSGKNVVAGASLVLGNALEVDFLKSDVGSGWDVVVDFMSYTSDEFASRKDYLLSIAEHYIFISSARVYADSIYPITEGSDKILDVSKDRSYLKTDEYALSKARQERILETSIDRNWTIVRPYVTYADERLQLGAFEKENWLYRAFQGRKIIFCKDVESRYTTLTCADDVADCIARLIGDERFYTEDYNIVSSHPIQWKDVLNIYLDVLENRLGTRPQVKYVSLDEFLSCHGSKWQLKYDRLYHRVFNGEKVKRALNDFDVLKVKPERGLTSCLNKFLNEPSFRRISWRLEACRDFFALQYTPMNEIKGIKGKLVYLLYRIIFIRIKFL